MKILERLLNLKKPESKKQKEEEFVLPDYFEITSKDIDEYIYMTTSLAKTSPEELRRDGKKIYAEIEKYMKTQKYKILSSKFSELDFPAITVKKPPYIIANVDLTLGLEHIPFKRFVFNPSEGLAVFPVLNKGSNNTIGDFLILQAPGILNFTQMVYRKGKNLEFSYKLSILRGEYDNENEEISFTSCVEDRGVKTVAEYTYLEKQREFTLDFLNDQGMKVIIQDLDISEEELQMIYNYYQNLGNTDFTEMSIKLNELLQNRIAFISIMNGTLVIKGTEKNNGKIQTSLKEEELTEGMKKLIGRKLK